MSPLCRGRAILVYFSLLICLSVSAFSPSGGQTRAVDPMSGYCWPTVYDAEPTLAQYWVTISCLTPRWMWASVTDGGQTLTQFGSKHRDSTASMHAHAE